MQKGVKTLLLSRIAWHTQYMYVQWARAEWLSAFACGAVRMLWMKFNWYNLRSFEWNDILFFFFFLWTFFISFICVDNGFGGIQLDLCENWFMRFFSFNFQFIQKDLPKTRFQFSNYWSISYHIFVTGGALSFSWYWFNFIVIENTHQKFGEVKIIDETNWIECDLFWIDFE